MYKLILLLLIYFNSTLFSLQGSDQKKDEPKNKQNSSEEKNGPTKNIENDDKSSKKNSDNIKMKIFI